MGRKELINKGIIVNEHLKQQKESIEFELKKLRDRINTEQQLLSEAQAEGDLSENAAYHQHKTNKQKMEGDLRNLVNRKQAFDNLILYDFSKVNINEEHDNRIKEYSLVDIYCKTTGEQYYIEIVPERLGNVSVGAVARSSRLGLQLMGKRPGDIVIVETSVNKFEYHIKDVFNYGKEGKE